MNKTGINLQDTFLNQVRRENIPMTFFLINGYQIKGTVRSFDNFTIMLEVDGRQQLIYKHAISTIIPARNISLKVEGGQPGENSGRGFPASEI
ncbi:MAG: RNA chaperone Hfq [Firmicutes bacterium]|jgi:host factor-I protein|nr:RNA chaperone Hfq [Bacillota bacterium]